MTSEPRSIKLSEHWSFRKLIGPELPSDAFDDDPSREAMNSAHRIIQEVYGDSDRRRKFESDNSKI